MILHRMMDLRGYTSLPVKLVVCIVVQRAISLTSNSPSLNTFTTLLQAIAKIETDKASIDFEAQDDAYVAKILVQAGSGNDIECGTPILITVDDEGDVAAFKDYVLPAATETPKPSAPAAKSEEVAPKAAAAPVTVEPAKVAPPPQAPVVPTPTAVAVAPPPSTSTTTTSQAAGFAFRPTMSSSSVLRKTLGKSQQAYIERYGSTGQHPV
jgi:pyruvate dehydrogenase E2 component (dihydrolipoamide acetyltransferase)